MKARQQKLSQRRQVSCMARTRKYTFAGGLTMSETNTYERLYPSINPDGAPTRRPSSVSRSVRWKPVQCFGGGPSLRAGRDLARGDQGRSHLGPSAINQAVVGRQRTYRKRPGAHDIRSHTPCATPPVSIAIPAAMTLGDARSARDAGWIHRTTATVNQVRQ